MGNQNARKGGMKTIRRSWSTGTTLHTFKKTKKNPGKKKSRYNSRPNRMAQYEMSKAWERSHGKGSTPAGRYGG